MPVCPRCRAHAERNDEVCDLDGLFFVDEAALAEAADDDMLGRYLGDRFAIMRLLGGGGMGKVYQAIQRPVGRRVALKVLKSSLQENQRFLKRFEREAQAIAALNHPNIVTLYDFGRDHSDGTHYIAMEYVEGRLLTPFLREPLEIAFIIHVTAQVLAALQEAHEHGIIHRDLKPDNVMITSVGGDDVFVKVLDFGLAQLADPGEEANKITAAGEVFGTPLYMSPEQAAGEEIGPPADLYALACIVYELLCGRPPFQGTRPMNVLMKHVNAPVPPLTLKPGLSLSPEFEALVMRCLAKHPHERYPSARAMLDALFGTPEGRAIATSVPSMTRSIELPMVTAVTESERLTMPGAAVERTGVDFTSGPADLPLGSTLPPTSVDSVPGGGKRPARPASQHRLALAIGAVVALALAVVVLVMVFARSSSTNDVAAADTRSARANEAGATSSELGAVGQARHRLNDASMRAGLEVQARHAFDPVVRALNSPGTFKPNAIKVLNPKLVGVPWHEQVKVFHRKQVNTSSYTDPAELLFGN